MFSKRSPSPCTTVPLSDRALTILEALPRTGSYIFVNAAGKRIAHTAMRRLLVRTVGENNFTLHGFRSAFRDWAGEHTNFDREVIEHALAHKLPDRVEAAYRRGTALDKRRRLMSAWANFCTGQLAGSNVTPLRA
jgi:integrase